MKRSVESTAVDNQQKRSRIDEASSELTAIRPSEVPEYLRESEFFKSLNTEDDEKFHIPGTFMKANTSVESLQDASDLLHTIRFWGVKVSLMSILQFAMKQPPSEVESALRRFEIEFQSIRNLLHALNEDIALANRMKWAMELGEIELVEHLASQGAKCSFNAIAAAATAGNVDCLKYALQRIESTQPNPDKSMVHVYEGAVANGHMDCVRLLDQSILSLHTIHVCPLYPLYYKQPNIVSVAARNCQLECLKFLHSKGLFVNHSIGAAAAGGSLPCLKFIIEHISFVVMYLNGRHCKEAAAHGSIACLRYLHGLGCPWGYETAECAAEAGSLECLQFYVENGGDQYDEFTILHAAALNGHLECLRYAHDHGCEIQKPLAIADLYQARFGVSHGPAYIAELTAKRQHWACVEYLLHHNCPLTRGLTTHLARGEKQDLLKMAVERGCPLSAEVCVHYATVGNLEMLTYAHEHGCSWSKRVCERAARGGHLQCLQYAREHGCPCDRREEDTATEYE